MYIYIHISIYTYIYVCIYLYMCTAEAGGFRSSIEVHYPCIFEMSCSLYFTVFSALPISSEHLELGISSRTTQQYWIQ